MQRQADRSAAAAVPRSLSRNGVGPDGIPGQAPGPDILELASSASVVIRGGIQEPGDLLLLVLQGDSHMEHFAVGADQD